MEPCEYEKVKIDELDKSRKPLLKQVLVCSAVWITFFATGLGFGAPTVIIPQLRREANSTDAVSPEMASWISSVTGYAALPWVFIVPLTSSKIGRKYPYYFISVCNLISFIVLFLSNTPEYILLSAILRGPVQGSNITIAVIIITEYTSPKYRGILLILKSANFNWGLWTANALGTFFHWKTIGVVGMTCCSVNLLTILFWCESPYWLASNFRYEACCKSHRWLKGKTHDSERELSGMIRSSREYQNQILAEGNNFSMKQSLQTMRKREFYKPVLLCMSMLALYHGSGKFVCSIYAIDIIKRITTSESTAYIGMLILDGVTVSAMYIGSGLSTILKRRTMLIATTTFGITFLFVLSFYLWLIYFSVIVEHKLISLALLAFFSFGISCGPIILAPAIYGELIPQKYKTSVMIVTGVFAETMLSTYLKFAPFLFRTFKLPGTFLFYGVVASCIFLALYKYLPETKDKTLQEINESLLGKGKKDIEQEKSFLQT